MVIPLNHVLYDDSDGRTFQDKMIDYIKEYWADTLGDDVKLLNLPNGLEIIAEKYGLNSEILKRRAV